MNILPTDIQNIIYEDVHKSLFCQVMRELEGVVKFKSGYGGSPDRAIFEIEWAGYKLKEGCSVQPFLPDKSQWNIKLRLKNPKHDIYVPWRLFNLNRDLLPFTQKNKPSELSRKCKQVEKIPKMRLEYLLGEYL